MIPHLYTNDLQATIRYYTNVLCFESDLQPGELGENTCMLRSGRSSIVFEENPHRLDHSVWGKLNFFVDDVSAIFSNVCDFADVQSNIQIAVQGTAEFRVKDCNGIELIFSEVQNVEQTFGGNDIERIKDTPLENR